MAMKKRKPLARRGGRESQSGGLRQEERATIWEGLLNAWYSMLNSVDYLQSLTPYQVSLLSTEKIQSLGRKVRFLSVDGIRLWKNQQLECLGVEQLQALDAETTVVIAAHCSPELIERWIAKADDSAILQQLSFIMDGIKGQPSKMRALGDGLNMKEDITLGARILGRLTEILDNGLFRMVIVQLSDERLSDMILSDISEDLEGVPEFRRRVEEELRNFAREKARYEHRLNLFRRSIHDLSAFERRMVSASHRSIRKNVYSELQEWLAELPFSGLRQLLVSGEKIFLLPTLSAQNEVLKNLIDELKSAINNECDLFEAQHLLQWMPLTQLQDEWLRAKKRYSAVKKLLHKHAQELEKAEEKFRAKVSQKESREHLSRATLQEVDKHINKVRKLMQTIESASEKLLDIIEYVHLIKAGVEHRFDQERLAEENDEGEYVGDLPISLYKKLIALSLGTPDQETAQRAVIDFICQHEPLQRFKKHCKLYADVLSTGLQMQQLLDQLRALQTSGASFEGRGDLKIFIRCKKEVEAWEFLKSQALEFSDDIDVGSS